MKFTQTNMSEPIRRALSEINISNRYYADAVNGDDLNDGLTAQTAFKTLNRLSTELIGKVHTYTYVTLLPGVYEDGLSIYDSSGNIYIDGGQGEVIIQGLSPRGKVSSVYCNVYMANNSANITLNNIKFNHDSVSEEDKEFTHYVIYAHKGGNVILTGCTIDASATVGLKSPNSPVALYAKHSTTMSAHTGVIKNCGIAAYADHGGSVVTSNITFENILDGYAPMYGGIVNMVNYSNTALKLPRAKNSINYSIDTIEEGAIIESGTNDNGTYYKYANGLLVCTVNNLNFGPINISMGASGIFSTAETAWIFPHVFVNIPTISGLPSSGSGGSWLALSTIAFQTNRCDLVIMRPSQATYDELCNITAIGRWK